MSNPPGKSASREEETAFQVLEAVLSVDIRLADAGAGNGAPDGEWQLPSGGRAIVEVTSPPSERAVAEMVRQERNGEPVTECGPSLLRLNELAGVIDEMLAEQWALDNIEKLRRQDAEERHLFLFARKEPERAYFYRLSDTYPDAPPEAVGPIDMPAGVTEIWFRGRAARLPDSWDFQCSVASFRNDVGWQRHDVLVLEHSLPTPLHTVRDDPLAAGSRSPKDRK